MQGLSPHGILDTLMRYPRLVHFETNIDNSIETLIHRPELPRISVSTTRTAPAALLAAASHSPRSTRATLSWGSCRSLTKELDIDLSGLAFQSLHKNLRKLPSPKTLAVLDSDGLQNPGTTHTAMTVHLLLESLTPTDSATTSLCPHLRELRIAECRDLPDGEELLEFAQQRLNRTRCLTIIEVKHKMFMLTTDLHVLAPFAAHGLSISFSCPHFPSHRSRSPDIAWTGIDGSIVFGIGLDCPVQRLLQEIRIIACAFAYIQQIHSIIHLPAIQPRLARFSRHHLRNIFANFSTSALRSFTPSIPVLRYHQVANHGEVKEQGALSRSKNWYKQESVQKYAAKSGSRPQ
ncbi:hypothetical protein B0H14DRAFT_2573960 [Mycena olivaceomarginata]|nr:hypothetical protein B0H14DRAFT_2573960 [Mycena olivaceomarginata]